MVGLIGIVLFWILTVTLSLQCGAEIVALYLYKKHRISTEEYNEFISWKFLFNKIRD